MLRMKPTRIELNARDLNWHNARHENRQKQRAKGHSIPMQGDVPSHYINTNPLEVNDPAYLSPDRQPSEAMSIIAAPQMPLFSSKPDLQKFWSGVMIGAGVLPNMQQVISNKPIVVSRASSISSGLHSAKASLQEDFNNRCVIDEASYRDHVGNSDMPNVRKKTSHQHNLHGPPTLSDAQNCYGAESDVDLEPAQNLRATTEEFILHGNRLSHSSFVYHGRPNRANNQVSGLHGHDSHLRALDGSSDPFPRREGPQVEAAAIAERFDLSEGSRAYEEAPASHNRHSSFMSLGIEHISSLHISPSSSNEPTNHSNSTSTSLLQSLPLPVNRLHRLSSVHLRSPLYISQVPTSSSPEAQPRPPYNADELDFEDQIEAMTLQSRQRKRYKRRSQSYPYVLSEGEPTSDEPINGSRSRNNTPTYTHYRPTAIIPERTHTYLPPALVKGHYGHYDELNLSPGSGSSSATVSPMRRDLSLPTNPLTPRFDSSWDPPLPVPPHAFSAVRRGVSFTPTLPSTTPSPSSSPQITPLAIAQGHLVLSVAAPTPRTPSYEVYNDRLPASSQPQTPRGLPTNGVPRSGLPSVYRGAFTAPADLAMRARQRRFGVAHEESPTRQSIRGIGLRLDDQENERHGLETEMQWRRRASLRGFGQDVMDRSSEDADA